MKLKKSDYKLLIICISLVIISLIIFRIRNFKEEDRKNPQQSKSQFQLVDDYSRFFTVESCIYKYIVYLESEDFDNLFKVLDTDYIKKNNINSDNIYNFISKLEGSNSFVSKEMYYKNINDDFIRYYVYGELYKDDIDSSSKIGINYYIVDLDLKNNLFSIAPIDESSYMEVKNG